MSQLIESTELQEVRSIWIFIKPFLGKDFDDILQQYYNYHHYDEYKLM
jgi:hypothetical protein